VLAETIGIDISSLAGFSGHVTFVEKVYNID
jgi:hypothetical protein